MNKRQRSLILIVVSGCICAAGAGCSNSAGGGGNRQINPSAATPMSQAQKQQEIAKLKAQNPNFHVPPGLLAGSGPGQTLPPYLQKHTPASTSAAQKAP